jgi:hypothetical protein
MPRSVGRRADHRGPGLLAEATIEDRAPGVGWPRNQPFREADHLDGNLTERFKRIFKAKTWCRDASAHILSLREHPARGTGTVTPSQLGSCFLSAASRILESGSDSSPSGKCSGHRPVKPSKMNGRKGSGMKLSRNLVITAAVAAIAVIGGGTAFAATSGASSPARSVAGGPAPHPCTASPSGPPGSSTPVSTTMDGVGNQLVAGQARPVRPVREGQPARPERQERSARPGHQRLGPVAWTLRSTGTLDRPVLRSQPHVLPVTRML